jgi:hypothetical protein
MESKSSPSQPVDFSQGVLFADATEAIKTQAVEEEGTKGRYHRQTTRMQNGTQDPRTVSPRYSTQVDSM